MLSDFKYDLLELGSIDIAPILEEFNSLTKEDWYVNQHRQKIAKSAQAETMFIPIIYKSEKEYVTIEHLFLEKFPNTLKTVELALIKKLGKLEIDRAIVTCLPAKKKIPAHTDSGAFLAAHHRIHIPLISNPGVVFGYWHTENQDWKDIYMEPGKCYALNNCTTGHRVYNSSNLDRYHLIVDINYMQNRQLI